MAKKRGKKRGRKSKRLYFTEDTEQAIVEYLASDDQDERNKIYNKSKQNYSIFLLILSDFNISQL